MSANSKFYQSKHWKRKREYILRRDQYLCQECKRTGRSTPANVVHHIVPLDEDMSLKYTNANLISVCNVCHNGFHDRFNNAELTVKGEQLKRRKLPEIKRHEKPYVSRG